MGIWNSRFQRKKGNFSHLIFNGDKIVKEFSNWDEILGFFPLRGQFLSRFFSGEGSQRVCDAGVYIMRAYKNNSVKLA